MKERPLSVWSVFHGKPVSHNQAEAEHPNASALLRQLVTDGDAVGQFAFDHNGEMDLIVFQRGGGPLNERTAESDERVRAPLDNRGSITRTNGSPEPLTQNNGGDINPVGSNGGSTEGGR